MDTLDRKGILHGAAAYVIWGAFPLYFRLLKASGAVEIVLHRVLWSLLVCLVLTMVTRGVWPAVREPKRLILPGTAAIVLAINWGVYIYGVNSGQVVETSLGYFINPIVTVLLGVVILRETLRPLQWAALGIGAFAVVVLTLDYGRPPWIALILAVSFGFYGLVKNRVGVSTGAVTGMTTETLVLAPLALAGLAWFGTTGDAAFTQDPPRQALLLASTGVATVIPLLLFASAARRIPLSTLGLLQYLAPVLQLLAGVTFLGEELHGTRLVGFVIVWSALVLLSIDQIRHSKNRRAAERALHGAPRPANPANPANAAT